MIDRATGEFKCDSCKRWFNLPGEGFGMKRVFKDCKEALEKEVDNVINR